jgi:putative flippase GtrA
MKRNGIQFIKFCMVGGVNAGIDFTVFTLLTLAGMPYVAAQCVSYLCGGLNSYIMNRKWTFQSKGTFNRIESMKFITINALSLLITSALLIVLHQYLHWPVTLSKLVSMGAGLMLNYLGNRLWVFESAHAIKPTHS